MGFSRRRSSTVAIRPKHGRLYVRALILTLATVLAACMLGLSSSPRADAAQTGGGGPSCASLQSKVGDFRYAHFDNDYYKREDPADGHKVSDHDSPILTLSCGNSW